MASGVVCRACLGAAGPMEGLRGPLREHFHAVTGIQETDSAVLPPWLCLRCAQAVRSALRLRCTARLAHEALLASSNHTEVKLEIHEDAGLTLSGTVQLSLEAAVRPPRLNVGLLLLQEAVEDDWTDRYHDDHLDNSPEDIKMEHDLDMPQVKLEEFDELDDLPLIHSSLEREHRERKHHKRKNGLKKKSKDKDRKAGRSRKKVKLEEGGERKVSSRMVLETEEYTVIKLSREQLLLEREAALRSERFLSAPFQCHACAKGFNYEDVLQNHATKHRPENGALECEFCHQFLPSAVSLRGHLKSHSTKYRCKRCGVVKASRQHLLEHHALQHGGSPRTYVCNVCGKTLTKRTMFQKHMRVHFPSTKVACDKCGKLFKTIETLRAHMLHHEDANNPRHADVKRYACDQCPKAFRYASLLYTHKVTHITTRDYYCVECDLHFKTQSNLRLHLRKSLKHVDPDSLRWACEECERRYPDERALRQHVQWVHLKQRNYSCPVCERQFGSRDGLRSHRKKIHDGVRPPRSHVCDFCDKAFRAKAVLVKHVRVHTGERPFECEECGKKFAQHSTLNTHVRLVHLKVQRVRAARGGEQ